MRSDKIPKGTTGRSAVREVSRIRREQAGTAAPDVLAWEQIEAGRYRPRRTRGSFPGRDLG